ncbi:UNKNOWN [Stylonychia lemnae]|uniref:RING-type domain-containing protein n=1 Tax=Stylonychia lemnae TaxID=5949 RepID=A0A078B3K6_STYLE|nr:UNKNOWN [Stylonychia lemnae]|eukprot:CDW89034.1 UNKNOWN [Stylonychia lemnae]
MKSIKDLLQDYDKDFTPFLCPKCYASYCPDNNMPVGLACCSRSICQNCVSKINLQMDQCPQCHQQIGKVNNNNFQLIDGLQKLVDQNKPPREIIYKKLFSIGFIPNTLNVEYFNYLYFDQRPFQADIKQMQMNKDHDSMLDEQILTVELSQPYYFTRAYLSLKDNLVTDGTSRFVIKNPRDHLISARQEFREIMQARFSFVFVQHGYPLETNYVIIDGLSELVTENDIKKANQEKYPMIQNAKITKYKTNQSQILCHMILDFKDDSLTADEFGVQISSYGLFLDQLNTQGSHIFVRRQIHPYYRSLFQVSRNIEQKYPQQPRFQDNNHYQHRSNNNQNDRQFNDNNFNRENGRGRGNKYPNNYDRNMHQNTHPVYGQNNHEDQEDNQGSYQMRGRGQGRGGYVNQREGGNQRNDENQYERRARGGRGGRASQESDRYRPRSRQSSINQENDMQQERFSDNQGNNEQQPEVQNNQPEVQNNQLFNNEEEAKSYEIQEPARNKVDKDGFIQVQERPKLFGRGQRGQMREDDQEQKGYRGNRGGMYNRGGYNQNERPQYRQSEDRFNENGNEDRPYSRGQRGQRGGAYDRGERGRGNGRGRGRAREEYQNNNYQSNNLFQEDEKQVEEKGEINNEGQGFNQNQNEFRNERETEQRNYEQDGNRGRSRSRGIEQPAARGDNGRARMFGRSKR